METWYEFWANNRESLYGYGTSNEAEKYCEFLNQDREIHLFYVDECPQEKCDRLAERTDTFNLADTLAQI